MKILKIYIKEERLIKYYVIKHLILINITIFDVNSSTCIDFGIEHNEMDPTVNM